jgi:hypothetical protein
MALSNDPGFGLLRGAAITKANTLPKYTVATLPAAAGHDGRMIWVANGNAGAPCMAVSNGSAWLRIIPGTAVAAT